MITDKKVQEWENLAWSDKKPEKKYEKLNKDFKKRGLEVVSCADVEELVDGVFIKTYKRLELAKSDDEESQCVIFVPLDYE